MKKIFSIISMFTFPALAFAQGINVKDAASLIDLVNSILKSVLPIIIAIAVIYFVYNAFMYMIAADEERKGEAKSKMIYGIIALFVMVSVWGLVAVLSGTFGFTNTQPPPLPGLPNETSF